MSLKDLLNKLVYTQPTINRRGQSKLLTGKGTDTEIVSQKLKPQMLTVYTDKGLFIAWDSQVTILVPNLILFHQFYLPQRHALDSALSPQNRMHPPLKTKLID